MNKILFLVALLASTLNISALADTFDIYGRVIESAEGKYHYLDSGDYKLVRRDGSTSFGSSTPILGWRPSFEGYEVIAPPRSWMECVKYFVHEGKPRLAYITSGLLVSDFDPFYGDKLFVLEYDESSASWSEVVPDGMRYNDPAVNRGSFGLAVDDLNLDSFPDIIVGHTDGFRVYLGRSDGLYDELPSDTRAGEVDVVVTADVDQNGKPDLVTIPWSGMITVWYGDGSGNFPTFEQRTGTFSGYNDMETGDVDGDGRDELVVMSGQGRVPNFTVYELQPGLPFVLERFVGDREIVDGVGLGDFTGDGSADIMLSHGWNSPTWIWEYDTTSGLIPDMPTGQPASYDIPQSIEVGNVSCNDGLTDLVVVHGGWLRVGVYYQLEEVGLQEETLYEIPYESHYDPARGIDIGDPGDDGGGDIFVLGPNNGLVWVKSSCCIAGDTGDPGILRLAKQPEEPGAEDIRFSWDDREGDWDVVRATELPFDFDTAETICNAWGGTGDCTELAEASVGAGEWLQFYKLSKYCGGWGIR